MISLKKWVPAWIPALIWMGFIFFLSSLSGPTLKSVGLGSESIHIDGHFMLFVILCPLYFKATKSAKISLLLSILYAVLDEIHQIFTPFRTPSLFDVSIDTMGASFSIFMLWKLLPILPKKLKNWLLN